MNGRFQELGERFAALYAQETGFDELDDVELEDLILGFLSNQGIDEAWMNEAVAVVYEVLVEAGLR